MDDCLGVEDITTNMFINEAVSVVDEVNLDVFFDASEPQESSDNTGEVSCLRILTSKAMSIQLVVNTPYL